MPKKSFQRMAYSTAEFKRSLALKRTKGRIWDEKQQNV